VATEAAWLNGNNLEKETTKKKKGKNERKGLTLTGLLMEGVMERAMGIEPTSEAWEASILPLYDARPFSSSLIIHGLRSSRYIGL
jgi:hypothetical protein